MTSLPILAGRPIALPDGSVIFSQGHPLRHAAVGSECCFWKCTGGSFIVNPALGVGELFPVAAKPKYSLGSVIPLSLR